MKMFDNPFEFFPDLNMDGKHDILDVIIADAILEEEENEESEDDDWD